MWDVTEKFLIKDEKVEYVDRPSLWSRWISIAIVILFSIGFLSALVQNDETSKEMVPMFPLYIAPFAYWICTTLATKYAITNKRIITRTGVFTDNIKAVSYTHITSVQVEESIFGKSLGYGSLRFDTSGSGSAIEQTWDYTKAAFRVRQLLDKHVK